MPMNDRKERILRAGWGATIRRFLIMFLPLAALVGIVLTLFYYADVQSERKIIEAKEVHNVDLAMAIIVGDLSSIFSDLLILSEEHTLRRVLEAEDEQEYRAELRDLKNNFLSFSSRKEVYDQIRFLDETGMEMVRVNYNDGNPTIVPEEQLESKAGRYYFNDTFVLALGEIFMSRFDLNIENGEIEKPLKPVIRFATPVFDSSGKKRGIVIINYLGVNLFRNLERVFADTLGQLMLLNRDGFWINSPAPEDEWGFMYEDREDRTFGNAFGEAWQEISARQSGQFEDTDGMFTFGTVDLLLEDQEPGSEWDKGSQPSLARHLTEDNHWKLVSRLSPDIVKGISGKFLAEFLPIYALLVGLLAFASWFVARASVERKKMDKALGKERHDLGERVKELNCLYGISRLVEKKNISLEEILEDTVNLISPSWQYPEITAARIVLGDRSFQSKNFRESVYKQTQDIKVNGQKAGLVEVVYLEERPESDEGPFLKEERLLIGAVAKQLGGIIDRKEAEEEAKNLAKFPDENPNPVLRVAQDSNVLYCNRTGLPLLDFWGSALGQPLPDFWHQTINDVLSSNSSKTIEVVLRDRIFSFMATPVAGRGYINLYGEDITQRRKTEKEVVWVGRDLRQVIETVNVPIIGVDVKGLLNEWNQKAADIAGYSKDEVLGRSFVEDFVGDDYKASFQELSDKTLKGEETASVEFPLYTKDGQEVTVLFSATARRDASGNIVGIFGIGQDITERKRIEQMKSDFVSLASHELRTPLTSIGGYVELILDGDVGEISKEQREFLEIVSQNAQRLETLINDVLDIEKIESGRVEMRQEKVNLSEVVEDCINTFEVMAKNKALRLEKDIKVAQMHVLGDSDRLSQVFSNLLSDAIKYTKEGRVKVTAQVKGKLVSVTVEDTGIGMSQEDLSRIFTGFFRSDNSYVRKTTGTGLGLSIAKATIEKHNGDIKVESKLGVGTKFEVILPLLKEAKKVD